MSDMFGDEPSPDSAAPLGAAEPRKVRAGRGWQWIVEAFQIVRGQLLMWILLLLAYVLIMVLVGQVPLIGKVVEVLLAPLFAGSFMLAAHRSAEGGELELGDLFAGFRAPLRPLLGLACGYVAVLLATFLFTALLAAGAAMLLKLGGLMPGMQMDDHPPLLFMAVLTVVGGTLLILAGLSFWLAPALVVLGGVTPLSSLRLSLRAGLRNWLPFTVYSTMLLILAFLAGLPLGLGLLVWLPVAHVSYYTAWRDIFSPDEVPTGDIVVG